MSTPNTRIAITGATGFIGRSVVSQLANRNMPTRVLVRGAYTHPNVESIRGDLLNDAALADFVAGADTVIHIAGLTKARTRQQLFAVNETGAANVATAARKARVRRFILVSSLAAREPHLSDYAASKRAGEDVVRTMLGDMELVIVRPPAIIGPGDPATEPMLTAMRRGLLPAPAGKARREGRMSFVYMDDIARFLIEQIDAPLSANPLEPYGGTPKTSWDELANTAADLLGKPVRIVPIPPTVLKIGAFVTQTWAAIFMRSGFFNTGKVRELLHNDWTGEVAIANARSLRESLRLAFGMDVKV